MEKWQIIICDVYQETRPKVGKYKSKLGAKTGFRVEFVKIEIMVNYCRKRYGKSQKIVPHCECNI